MKVNAKVGLPLIGKVNAEVLADLTEGFAYEYVPFLGLCQKTPLNVTVNLKSALEQVYSPTGGIPQIVAQLPTGEQPASFQDSDFTITGCHKYNEDPATRINLWID